MTRLTLVFAALLCFLSSATATFSPHADFAPIGNDALPPTYKTRFPDLARNASFPLARNAARSQSFEVTDGTGIWLDGQSCKLQDVPSTATIVSLELEADGKTVTKIRFKSKQVSGAER